MDSWRPFEPSREAVDAARREAEANTCNRHNDCEAATKAYIERRKLKHAWEMPVDFHCHNENCEECFGC